MRPDNFNVHELINALQGTCDSIDDHLPEGMAFEDLTKIDTDTIDSEIFCCSQCGWWCEVSEQSEDGEERCTDCSEED